jgi:hypothetical protein
VENLFHADAVLDPLGQGPADLKTRMKLASLSALGLFAGIAALSYSAGRYANRNTPTNYLTGLNADYIDGLYEDEALEDVDAVFGHILSRLPERVTVYPSEGYFYFDFPLRGSRIKGTMLFESKSRNHGILEFGYVGELESRPSPAHRQMPGRSKDYGPEDGLLLTRLAPLEYQVKYKGITVIFELFEPSQAEPRKMRTGEEFLARCMDESGIQFDLIFDTLAGQLAWAVDRSRFVPENLIATHEGVSLGARTRFVFLNDLEFDRLVLIGVHKEEVVANTWFDGPFDQGPDFAVEAGRLDLRDYLGAHSGADMTKIDAFGHLIDRSGVRLPIAPYRLYENIEEFDEVEAMIQEGRDLREIMLQFARESFLSGERGGLTESE